MRKRRHGEGSIDCLPSGKYRARITIKGKSYASEPLKYHKDAVNWIRELIGEQDRFTVVGAGRLKLSEWLDRWLQLKSDHLKPSGYEWYEQRIDKHIKPRIGQLIVSQIDKSVVDDWMIAMKKEGVTDGERKNSLKTLRSALKVAMEDGVISRNPAKLVKFPKVSHRDMLCLDDDQTRKLIEASRVSSYRNVAFIPLAIDTGARPNELLALHWHEVDLEKGSVSIKWNLIEKNGRLVLDTPKTRKGLRTILICPETVEILKAHRDTISPPKSKLVFPNVRGGFTRLTDLREYCWKPIRRDAKLPKLLRLYDLRHTSATILLSHGVNIRAISDRLGHEDIAITLKHYSHAMPLHQEQSRIAMSEVFRSVSADTLKPS